jgi:alpha-D-ribose 1-methylphosphonate 5-phosphate C-P lyase
MNYAKFHGKRIEDICIHNIEKSSYCKNYYIDDEGNEIFVWSDDDNYSTYEYNGVEFGESFTSCGDVIEVYDEFLKEN